MSYHHHPGRGRALVRLPPPAPLAGFLDFFTEPVKDLIDTVQGKEHEYAGMSDAGCIRARDQRTAGLDAQIEDLQRTWKPADLYTVADMTAMRDKVMALLLSVSRTLDVALAQGSTDIKSAIRQAQAMIYAKEQASLPFTAAINNATAKGIRVIESVDFKPWVINSMNKASVGMGFAAYVACLKPPVLALLQTTQLVWDAAYAVGKKMVRFAVDVGELVLSVPRTALGVMAYAKYGAAAVAAYYVYTKLLKKA